MYALHDTHLVNLILSKDYSLDKRVLGDVAEVVALHLVVEHPGLAGGGPPVVW